MCLESSMLAFSTDLSLCRWQQNYNLRLYPKLLSNQSRQFYIIALLFCRCFISRLFRLASILVSLYLDEHFLLILLLKFQPDILMNLMSFPKNLLKYLSNQQNTQSQYFSNKSISVNGYTSFFHNHLHSILQKKMGCEQSKLKQQLTVARTDTLSTEEDVELEFHKFIGRQRGEVVQLYHFSNVISRGHKTIVRKVLERNSRIERICKILTVKNKVKLISSYQYVEILKNLNHPNIMQIIEYFHEQNFLYIILENIPGKTLHQLYYQEQLQSMGVIVQIIKQILIALKFCHQKGYVHKSINPEHVMLVRLQKTKSFIVKIIGFGSALKNGAAKITNTMNLQNSIFTAPEVDNVTMAHKQDIWACGIIFLELLSGQKFENFILMKQFIIELTVKKLNLQEDQKRILSDLLNRMLDTSAESRLSAEQALKHKLFQLNLNNALSISHNSPQVLQKLMRYRVSNNLRSLFSMYASLNILSVVQKSQHLVQFYNLDKNKDGKIDFQELVEGVKNTFGYSHQVAVKSVKKIFQNANKNRQCSLSYVEYVTATSFISQQYYEQALVKLFGQIDTNKDGIISLQELSRSVEGVQCYQLLKNRQNSCITYDQFKSLMFNLFQEQKHYIQSN